MCCIAIRLSIYKKLLVCEQVIELHFVFHSQRMCLSTTWSCLKLWLSGGHGGQGVNVGYVGHVGGQVDTLDILERILFCIAL